MQYGIVVLATLSLYAIANITTKIYEKPIIVDHLALLERLYKSHKFVFLMLILANVIQISPVYEDYIWPYEAACRLNMVWMYSLWTIEMLCVTMFGFVKIRCYQELTQENHCEMSFHFVEIGLFIWSTVIFPTSSVVLGIMSKQYINGNDKTCLPRSWISLTSYFVNIIIYFSLNFFINYIIRKFQNARVHLIPELQKHIAWNAFILATLFITSFSLTLGAPMAFWIFPNEFAIVSFVIEVADGTTNHIIMFYSLHRSQAWKAIANADVAEKTSSNQTTSSNETTDHISIPIPAFLQSNIDDVVNESSEEETTDIETNENDIFWIGMKGFHPIPVLKKVMDRDNLWRFLIKDPNILRQIAKYYQKGHTHIPSMHWNAVSSSQELISNIEKQQTRSTSTETFTRSCTSDRDFIKIFYE